MPNKFNAERRHHIPKMSFKLTNWSEYEAGLRRRGSLTLWVTVTPSLRDAMMNHAEAMVSMSRLKPVVATSLRALARERLLAANAITTLAGVNAAAKKYFTPREPSDHSTGRKP